MLSKALTSGKYFFGLKDMKKAFYQFLNLQAGAIYRGTPQFKQRKYINVQITQKFKELQEKRKQQRLIYAQKKKKLLQQKLSTESKLLTEYEKTELSKLNEQIKSLQTLVDEQNKQLAEIDKQLQDTQADYVLIQGPRKLVVLNEIIYLKHINSIPSGVVLTPQAVKIVQNVHYLVTHNLPVPRYEIYQLLPDLFQKEIGELQQSVQKLIMEKNLNILEENTSSPIRQFKRNLRLKDPSQQQLLKLRLQRQNLMINMSMHHHDIMIPHLDYINKVLKGQTPFRNIRHCITALKSTKLNLKLTPEEEAFKKSLLETQSDFQKFKAFCIECNEKAIQIKYSYIQPPPYVKNHPILSEMYDKYMEKWTNPVFPEDMPKYLPNLPPNDDGRAFMEQRLRKQIQVHDEEFVKLWNEDKNLLIAKKKETEIEFYKFSTRILEEYQALQDKSGQQEFVKLPKKPKKKQEKFMRITIDQLTKMIFLNKQNRKKYNLQFFANYFGFETPQQRQDLHNMLNSVSYLRVLAPSEDNPEMKEVKQQVLKFVD